ncbi:MAG: hypothetical protein NTY20_00740 [Candidatus Aenigmarchaeota archaeon]|nr:hypothetical protein [Candidatus Aenigmarchaeota archaeon]
MKPFWIAALAVIFLSVPSASAIQPPDVTFIPDKISVNSSFIMIADPHASSGESVSVKWIVYGVQYGYWSINFVGNKYVCYFSNTDIPNTCGPNMFPGPSYGVPYETDVIAVNQNNQNQTTSVNVSVGGIPISSQITTSGNIVYIKAWAGGSITGTISYKVYDTAGLNMVKSGTTIRNDMIYGYSTNITLSNGEYYIAFSATSPTDFGGGVARVVVGGGGGGTGSPDVKADSIAYSPVINPNQEFKIETFKITNLGTDNLTALSISVPQQISSYLTITPKKTSLEPNESTYMTVTLNNIQSSTNISTFATLLSGPTEIKQIPVELRISVIGAINPASCEGKSDMALCLGGICCGGICRTRGAECCSSSDCPSGKTCSSDFKCTSAVIPGECEGKSDMASCTGGICCSGSCITGGECCSSSDCNTDETCTYSNICEKSTPIGCTTNSDCSSGVCCSGSCQQCCTSSDCTGAGETCSDGICTGGTEPSPTGGFDITTIALIGGGVAAAAVVGFIVFKKFIKKKGGGGEEEFEEGGDEKEEDEFSDEDFY